MKVQVEGLLDYSFTIPDEIWNKAKEDKKADEVVLNQLAADKGESSKMDIVFYEVSDG